MRMHQKILLWFHLEIAVSWISWAARIIEKPAQRKSIRYFRWIDIFLNLLLLSYFNFFPHISLTRTIISMCFDNTLRFTDNQSKLCAKKIRVKSSVKTNKDDLLIGQSYEYKTHRCFFKAAKLRNCPLDYFANLKLLR